MLRSLALLAALYFARDVLVPIALAVMLSLALSPAVRWLRRAGFGHTSSVIAAVTVTVCAMLAVAVVIVSQLGRIASSLPHYEKTIELKIRGLDELTRARVTAVTGGAGAAATAAAPTPVQVLPAPRTAWQVIQSLAATAWPPLETAGIVLVVLLFVLLEYEALRDRLIKIAGIAELRVTTVALNDAGVRLSRFFATQFLVNCGVGLLIGLGLAALGIPHALVWAALTFVLRFVPYVGFWIAALLATALAAAIVPGWTLAGLTLALFVVLELITGQLVEPQLYGHTTGLSPLSVVIAAIFWSWLWGPVGLVLSTPLTLCLVVAGRHTRMLRLLDVLLGDAPALTMPQRLYQRALSGDSHEAISSARSYLRRGTLAAYCDLVLVPALQLAGADFEAGLISGDQASKVRDTLTQLIGWLGTAPEQRRGRKFKPSLLEDVNIGRALRNEREAREGRWQGPLAVPAASVVLGVALASANDELAAELLVLILRAHGVDARSLLSGELEQPAPPGASAASVSACFLVSTRFEDNRAALEHTAAVIRDHFPEAALVTLFFPSALTAAGPEERLTADDSVPPTAAVIDRAARTYVQALEIGLEIQARKAGAASLATAGQPGT